MSQPTGAEAFEPRRLGSVGPGMNELNEHACGLKKPDHGGQVWAKVPGMRHSLRLSGEVQVNLCYDKKKKKGCLNSCERLRTQIS